VPVVATPTPDPGPCDAGSLLTIWAHYDDDIIFSHGRIMQALDAGWCVTVAYLTGGDAGRGVQYSEDREGGIRDAYDEMRGWDGQWESSTDTLNTGVTVAEWTPSDAPGFTLLSFRLADGNLDGSGFASMGYESLKKLQAGTIDSIRDIDGPEQLTRDDITHSLVEIIGDAGPTLLATHIPGESVQLASGDHADHSAVGSFVRAAWQSAGIPADDVSYSVGYQTSGYDANITGDVLAVKVAGFSAYAVQDPVTSDCRDLTSCLNLRLFGAWLQREYAATEAELGLG
jgi:LmbE family N-acetylglucosaminyl deacetylase